MLTEKELYSLFETMSFEEKMGELLQLSARFYGADGEITGLNPDDQFSTDDVIHAGSILNTYGVDQLRIIQQEHLKHDKIPMIFMGDVTSGYSASQPVPLAQACSFNPKLVEELCKSAAEAATADGVSVTYSPMVDLCRDARWGRVSESYGEDTYLSSVMSAAAVRGYQGDDPSADNTMSACVKHFASYGYPEAGIDYNNVEISERTLKQEFLPAYKSAVDAGCDMVMASFNSVGGIPVTINSKLLKDTLRDEWKFDGVVISDWASLLRCYNKLHATNCEEDVVYYAAKATVDIDMVDYLYTKYYKKLIDEGKISESTFNDSVMRVLRLKNKQGILEDPYKYLRGRTVDHDFHYQLARKAVQESCVLLENKENILPLNKGEKIALIGPYAVRDRAVTMWSKRHKNEAGAKIKTTKKAFEELLENEVMVEPGCPLIPRDSDLSKAINEEDICYDNPELYFNRALDVAQKSDKVVLMLGEHREQSGESTSRTKIDIDETQIKLLKEIYKVNKNIITVVYAARPISLQAVKEFSKAVIFVFMPGDAGSEGLADIICGRVSPSGRLAMSLPYNSGQCPMHYGTYQDGSKNQLLPKFHTRYVDSPLKPLYSFGYGLSYSTFDYSNIILSNNIIRKDETITAKVTVTNTGKYDSYEVVQLYLQDVFATLVSRPFRELKGFKKIFIRAGESIDVTFEINEDMLKFYDSNLNYISESGSHRVFIGPNSDTENCEEFSFLDN